MVSKLNHGLTVLTDFLMTPDKDTVDVMVNLADSTSIVLPNITKQSFNKAILDNDVEFFTDKLLSAVVLKCDSPLVVFCTTDRSEISVAISLVG